MDRRTVVLVAATFALALGPISGPALAATTLVGNSSQADHQTGDSSQSAVNGGVAGNAVIGGDLAPTVDQVSSNVLDHTGSVGGCTSPFCVTLPGAQTPGGGTLIAPPGSAGFGQSSHQGVHSEQAADNGTGGSGTTLILGSDAPMLAQDSANVLSGAQSTASCASDVCVGSSATGGDTIIGGTSQASTQDVNSGQSGRNGTGGSGTTTVLGSALPTLEQDSDNVLTSGQSVAGCVGAAFCDNLGGGGATIIGGNVQASRQGVDSGQSASNGSGGSGFLFVGGSDRSGLGQDSTNRLSSAQAVGGCSGAVCLAGTGDTIIGDTSQGSAQGVGSSQAAANGDGASGRTAIAGDAAATLMQGSTNAVTSGESRAGCSGGICFVGPAAGGPAGDAQIGNSAQANTQGVGSSQRHRNGSAGTGILFVAAGDLAAVNAQSLNDLNSSIVAGGCSPPQC